MIVQKFGGTSVNGFERIQSTADLILQEYEKGNKVAVVVSAMAGTTDSLVQEALTYGNLGDSAALAEYDSIVSSGEQVSAGLLALALQNRGYKARSWMGWQLPIITDANFAAAKVISLETNNIEQDLAQGIIPIIAGFQGLYNGRTTTLGRGGSDTSAAALAAALKADRCDIYTDVDGIYTADPRIVFKARKLKSITFEEMLEMSAAGAKVLHSRSVEIAIRYNLKMRVLSSFIENDEGTMIVNEQDIIEQHTITGITCEGNVVGITIKGLEDIPGMAASLFEPISQKNIKVDLIVQNISSKNKTDLTFTVSASEMHRTLQVIKTNKKVKYRELIVDDNVAKISVIGIGMKTHSGVAQKMFEILSNRAINILMISTSEIKISVLVHAEYKELAVRALHTGFGLDVEV